MEMEAKVKESNKHKEKENKDLDVIKELQEQNKELSDKNLRLQAEFINYRNRTANEISEMLKYEGESFIKELLPIVDNFERAISLDDSDLGDDVSKFLSGFKMVYGNLMSIFEKIGVKEIDCEGKEFSPEFAEAVLTDHDENKPEIVILEVIMKGYTYKGKVIRPAKVKINR